MAEPPPPREPKAYAVFLRTALGPWTVQFHKPGYIAEKTMEMLETRVCKRILEDSRTNMEVREEIANCPEAWKEIGELLAAAVPSLEKRCFAAPDPAAPEYEGLSGPLIASFSASLLKDLDRLNLIMLIARNVLTIGEPAQNLAAKHQTDEEVFKLISVCVKVTARGYDGEAGNADEDKWQSVINTYKKLLITCLQFLNNLTAANERRKLMLWVQLFDSSTEHILPDLRELRTKLDEIPKLDEEMVQILANALLPFPNLTSKTSVSETNQDIKAMQQPSSSPFLLYLAKMRDEIKRYLIEQRQNAGANEIAAESKKRWQSMSEEERNKWNMLYADIIAKPREELAASSAFKGVVDQHAKNEENVQQLARSINQLQLEVDKMRKSVDASSKGPVVPESKGIEDVEKAVPLAPLKEIRPYLPMSANMPDAPPASDNDFRMDYPASYGVQILQRGKDDLMKRLETYSERLPAAQAGSVASPSSPVDSPASPKPDPRIISSDEESEDDYVVAGDDSRGLLTDVPLILGPTEIEVLPMIIMNGIYPPLEGTPGYGSSSDEIIAIKNMHTVRCHLLLAQDNGRNLLRELLIFVAAWDLREDELYFKFMVKIMEAILSNGLMPFSYYAFREWGYRLTPYDHLPWLTEHRSKDIISPAQAVIMKLLTNIFRARQAAQSSRNIDRARMSDRDGNNAYPTKVDVHMVKFLLTEFRRSIIPQTCALIFLQGQIRAGHAHPEDFPLNLWDMERMYEGVYQYLEFFAILTEHEVWKNMMADWEITSELVTLLKELDAAIPKGQIPVAPLASKNTQTEGASPQSATAPAPVAVERPYDVTNGQAAQPVLPDPYPEQRPYIDEAQDEPSDFEWRNLKKLAVLVLSSLVWKSPKVQDQVRPLGGIEAILNCCTYDEHNPYIREHAIMCLRFLMEGNPDNQARIRDLEPRGAVPNEVLDQHGYETYMDSKGQVMLRRKEVLKSVPVAGSSKSAGKQAIAKDPKDLQQLVEQVMKELPQRVQGAKYDAEKAAALAKLDKAFDNAR